MAVIHQWVPDFLSRNTENNFEYSLDKVEDQDPPHDKLNTYVKADVGSATWNKDPQVL